MLGGGGAGEAWERWIVLTARLPETWARATSDEEGVSPAWGSLPRSASCGPDSSRPPRDGTRERLDVARVLSNDGAVTDRTP
ncbi:hypothetical protein TBR22_A13590 [Luteitalea sp. TBR-22]|nr:hypothetical protein TBR22_A13590 [Luteitalea sp. TBR-22]